MPNFHPTQLQLQQRRQKVAARYLRGQSQWEIAHAFEVDQATISRDLVALHAEWLAQSMLDIDAIKARELAKTDEVERQAWEAWSRSCQDAQTLKARVRGDSSATEKTVKGQAGDPRFLAIVLECVEKRCKILGVIATGGMTNDQIDRLLDAEFARISGADRPQISTAGVQAQSPGASAQALPGPEGTGQPGPASNPPPGPDAGDAHGQHDA